jgi:predicted nucleic-acid-binding protein
MIGLDTNVLIRYLMRDDPAQSAAAIKLIRSFSSEAPGFLSLVVIAEIIWVLQSSYSFEKTQIEETLEILLRSHELTVERSDLVWQALRAYSAGRSDFADCLIERCSHAAGCSYTATFDRAASRAGMRLIT